MSSQSTYSGLGGVGSALHTRPTALDADRPTLITQVAGMDAIAACGATPALDDTPMPPSGVACTWTVSRPVAPAAVSHFSMRATASMRGSGFARLALIDSSMPRLSCRMLSSSAQLFCWTTRVLCTVFSNIKGDVSLHGAGSHRHKRGAVGRRFSTRRSLAACVLYYCSPRDLSRADRQRTFCAGAWHNRSPTSQHGQDKTKNQPPCSDSPPRAQHPS